MTEFLYVDPPTTVQQSFEMVLKDFALANEVVFLQDPPSDMRTLEIIMPVKQNTMSLFAQQLESEFGKNSLVYGIGGYKLRGIGVSVKSVSDEKVSFLLIIDEGPPVWRLQKTNPLAIEPTKGSLYSAGFDLYACSNGVVPAHGKALIFVGWKMAIPLGLYGRIAPRSGLAVKHFIDVGAGVVDADYRGDVAVLLFNHGDCDFAYQQGQAIAQLILERCVHNIDKEVVAKLSNTERNEGGFGSTDKMPTMNHVNQY